MVTIYQPNNLVIESEQGTLDYLFGVAVTARTPWERGTRVNINDRSTLPSNVAVYNVGIVIESPDGQPTAWILVLNQDGGEAVIAIPKAALSAR